MSTPEVTGSSASDSVIHNSLPSCVGHSNTMYSPLEFQAPNKAPDSILVNCSRLVPSAEIRYNCEVPVVSLSKTSFAPSGAQSYQPIFSVKSVPYSKVVSSVSTLNEYNR